MRILFAAVSMVLASSALAAQVQIENVRIWPAPDNTRVVFDVSGPVDHSLFSLKHPDRVVIDFKNTGLPPGVTPPAVKENLVAGVRSAVRNGQDVRVVLDLTKSTRPKSFLLKPNSKYGHRLVIDLYGANVEKGPGPIVKAVPREPKKLRDLVVAIDPGHGGEDPGALGPHGVLEKDVVLAVAKRLKATLDKERGIRAVLVRNGDYFLRLRKRIKIARQERADLFVSIHADAFRDPRVYGSSVYVLSRNGAGNEAARWLANQENASDLIGGVSLADKDDLLASVLLDLSQTATLSASAEAAEKVLGQLKGLGKTHKRRVQRAGFLVLKSPDIPSILVETAYISNPTEARKLTEPGHQQRLAAAMARGIQRYLEKNAPPGTVLAARRHVIAQGDTLSELARRYHVTMQGLRTANELIGDRLRVGRVMRIPLAGDS